MLSGVSLDEVATFIAFAFPLALAFGLVLAFGAALAFGAVSVCLGDAFLFFGEDSVGGSLFTTGVGSACVSSSSNGPPLLVVLLAAVLAAAFLVAIFLTAAAFFGCALTLAFACTFGVTFGFVGFSSVSFFSSSS